MFKEVSLKLTSRVSHCVCGRLVTCPCLDLNVLGGWRHAEDVFHTFGQIELAWSVDVGVVLHRVSHSIEGLGFRVGEFTASLYCNGLKPAELSV